ncbi:hypothetical protein GRI58_15025 [Porphyrobacter algicida]|uniref:Uncharacterized protein n=1 Tax=Qipengyuania algicida TaxID=1836209 RepID=A0A845AIN5_9SPHN|nr:hypothetical protein [Qipengyuania algicida]MXP30120.1 hypothetical protein [Qipengyuania algicida]
MSLSFAIMIFAAGTNASESKPIPDGYSIMQGDELKNTITGAMVVPKAAQGQDPPGELYSRDGEYRFFGPEPWSPRGPYIITFDRVCINLEKQICFKYYKNKFGSFVRKDVTNPYSDYEYINISR